MFFTCLVILRTLIYKNTNRSTLTHLRSGLNWLNEKCKVHCTSSPWDHTMTKYGFYRNLSLSYHQIIICERENVHVHILNADEVVKEYHPINLPSLDQIISYHHTIKKMFKIYRVLTHRFTQHSTQSSQLVNLTTLSSSKPLSCDDHNLLLSKSFYIYINKNQNTMHILFIHPACSRKYIIFIQMCIIFSHFYAIYVCLHSVIALVFCTLNGFVKKQRTTKHVQKMCK